ncbi:hypothetical protein D3C85_1482000 [compost metagenome]
MTATPWRLSSALSTWVTRGTQPPQEVPALVQDLSSPMVWTPPAMAEHSWPLLTLLHELRLPGVLPRASPMLATSTPMSLSLVLMSAPVNVASACPARWAAATRAMS